MSPRTQSATASRSFKPRLECLEDRLAPAVFVVNDLADAADANPGDGIADTNLALAGLQTTLRAALQESNASVGVRDEIRFDLPGTGVRTIRPTAALPDIVDAVLIDGYTQAGATPNTLAVGSDAVLLVELNFGLIRNLTAGLRVAGTGGGTLIRGLVINGVQGGSGIRLEGVAPSTVEGNFIGLNAAGTARVFNAGAGVEVRGTGSRVGGTTPQARNVISGNGQGVLLAGSQIIVQGNYIGTNAAGTAGVPNVSAFGPSGGVVSSAGQGNLIGGTVPGAGNLISGNGVAAGVVLFRSRQDTVQGNIIGLAADGMTPLPNAIGVLIDGASDRGRLATTSDHLIGGNVPAARNIISGNRGSGIEIPRASDPLSLATRVRIQGNFIGTDVTGNLGRGNNSGIRIDTQGRNITIGGENPGEGNVIRFNRNNGVEVLGRETRILGNSISENTRLGIDLGPAGITPNDLRDPDTGGNNLQNFPVLASAVVSNNTTSVRGTLNSTANTLFRLEFFATASIETNGEGKALLGFLNVTTNASGNATFDITLPASPNPTQFVTATATDPAGNTSEFSANVAIRGETTAAVQSGQLIVTGSRFSDHLRLTFQPGRVTVEPRNNTLLNGGTAAITFQSITSAEVRGEDGADTVETLGSGFTGPIRLVGGLGNDRFVLGGLGLRITIDDPDGQNQVGFSLASAGVALDLRKNEGEVQQIGSGNQLQIMGNITRATGSPFTDVILGQAGVHHLTRTAGGDVLVLWDGAILGLVVPPDGMINRRWPSVVANFLHSPAFLGTQVLHFYQTLLGRPATPSELASWVAARQAGLAEQDVIVALLTSGELTARVPNNRTFVRLASAALLGRFPTDAEETLWLQIAATQGRGTLVRGILNSTESLRGVVDALYRQLLGRPGDALGLAILRAAGGRTDALIRAILLSREYAALSTPPGGF